MAEPKFSLNHRHVTRWIFSLYINSLRAGTLGMFFHPGSTKLRLPVPWNNNGTEAPHRGPQPDRTAGHPTGHAPPL